MKKFKQFMLERDGLADLGDQNLADDHEDLDSSPPDMQNVPRDSHALRIVQKAMKIALNAGEQYQRRIYSFLHRLARDLPQIHNIVSQLDDDEEEKKKYDNMPHDPNRPSNKPVISTPSADSPPDPQPQG